MNNRRLRTLAFATALATSLIPLPSAAQVLVGEIAPLATSVDESLHPLSMAEMAAGAPLVFFNGSAT